MLSVFWGDLILIKEPFFGMEAIKKGNIINFGVVLGEPSYNF